MDNSVKITAIIVGAIVLLAVIGWAAIFNLKGPSNTISVDGNSAIKVSPDMVGVYFNVETTGSTTGEATSNNSETVDNVITNLVKVGFERKDIQTIGFNVYKWQEWENNEYAEKGYKASNQIRLELTTARFALIGAVIDAGADAGASINYVSFELSSDKQNEYKKQAMTQAGEDARVKAEGIAEGVGAKLGSIVSISTSDWVYSPWSIYNNRGGLMMAEASAAKDAATNIQPSEQEVSGHVSIVYALR